MGFWMESLMDGGKVWIYGWLIGWMDERIDRWMVGNMDEGVDGWLDVVWVDE
jgi:hypothetical protein